MAEEGVPEQSVDQLATCLRRDVLALLGMAGAGAAAGLAPTAALAQAAAQVAAAAPPAGSPLLPWESYVEMLKPAGNLIDQTFFPKDEQVRAELYRQLVMNIAMGYIWYFQSTPEHPDWMPYQNSIFLLQPNPDGIYHLAPVDGAGVYRIKGYRGNNRIFGFAVGRGLMGSEGHGPGFQNYDGDTLTIGRDGAFEVIFSTERPAGWKGDWLYLHPEARSILVRQFSYNWGVDQEGRFGIERVDRPAFKPRLTVEQIARDLQLTLGSFTRRISNFTLGYQNKVTQNLGLNKMELTGFEDMGNSKTWPQKYWRCIYDVNPGEALIVETELPAKVKYWNVQINDVLWNQVEYGYRQSSLNAHQAKLDRDGKFRAVITTGEDPGVPNWLDTAGNTRGMLVGRWNTADSHPLPTIRKVPLAEVRGNLPADTPRVSAEQRDRDLRARNLGMQLRRRW